jgi:hypothetical protein
MGNIPKIRCAAQNALSSLAQKGDLLAIEPLDNSLAYWKQQKHENNINWLPGRAWEPMSRGSASAQTMEAEPPDMRYQAEPGNEYNH